MGEAMVAQRERGVRVLSATEIRERHRAPVKGPSAARLNRAILCAKLGEAAAMPPLRLDSATRVCAATEKASSGGRKGARRATHRMIEGAKRSGGEQPDPVSVEEGRVTWVEREERK